MDGATTGAENTGATETTEAVAKKDRKPVLNRIEAIVAEECLKQGEEPSAKIAEACLAEIAKQVYSDRVDVEKVTRWLGYDNGFLKARIAALTTPK